MLLGASRLMDVEANHSEANHSEANHSEANHSEAISSASEFESSKLCLRKAFLLSFSLP